MPFNSYTTISRKITRIVMLTCAAALVIMLALAIYIQGKALNNSLLDKTTTLARIIGSNSMTSVSNHDRFRAAKILRTLNQEPSVQIAYLINASGKIFAQFVNSNYAINNGIAADKRFDSQYLQIVSRSGNSIHTSDNSSLSVYTPIFNNDQYVGCVYIQVSRDMVIYNILRFIMVTLISFGIILMLALIVSNRMKRLITMPLQQLLERMRIITSDKNYLPDSDLPTHNNIAEIVELHSAFNNMLHEINRREIALEQYSHDLERQVAQRTSELSQKNQELQANVHSLRLARAQALESSAAKSRFLANMSHEIRTPMIGVLGMAELLKDRIDDPEQQEMAALIHSNGEKLLKILNDILDIAKIEAGKLEIEHTPFNLLALLEQIMELFAATAAGKGLELNLITTPGMPCSLTGDDKRLHQILSNLLSNAIKFTQHGHITVTVHVEQQGKNCTLNMQVRDSGIGLSDSAKKDIFEVFTQADSSTTRKYGGSGLGLAIVQQLIDLMQGSITVADASGGGTIFDATIPFTCHGKTETTVEQFTAKAVIASANDDLRTMLAGHLRHHGINCHCCDSCRELLHHTTAAPQGREYIFIDDALPGNILELFNALQRDDLRSIVYITPRCKPLGDASKTTMGITAILNKPLYPAAILQILRQLAGTKTVPQQTVSSSSSVPAKTPEKPDAANSCGGRVLLAEDNSTNQKLVSLILEQAGYSLTVVTNGVEALEVLRLQSFDIILMDCQMPVMDGFEATRIIRRGSDIPIIALTAHGGEDSVAECIAAGMNTHLCKPYRREQLLQVVASYINATGCNQEMER